MQHSYAPDIMLYNTWAILTYFVEYVDVDIGEGKVKGTNCVDESGSHDKEQSHVDPTVPWCD